jgi:hypothetical protein
MHLTDTEKLLLENIYHREQLVMQIYLQPVQAARAAAFGAIESRLGLPPGSLGRTHSIEGTGEVMRAGGPPAALSETT